MMASIIQGMGGGRALEVFLDVLLAGTVWVGLSLPFAAAHLEFWGWRRGRPDDRETAGHFGEAAVYNLVGLAASAAGVVALALARHPGALLPPLIWMAPVWPWAWFGAAGYAGLVLLCHMGREWTARRPLLHAACAAGAGGLALLLIPVWGAAAAAFSDPALWRALEESPWTVFRTRGVAFFTLHHVLAAGGAGGVALMLAGRRAFGWESAPSLSWGARLIRLGAAGLLAAAVLQVVASGIWVGVKGPAWVQGTFYGGGRTLMAAVAVLTGGIILILEVAVSALRRRGSAPRAGLAAAVLLAVIALASGWVRAGVEGAQPAQAAKAPAAPPGGGAPR